MDSTGPVGGTLTTWFAEFLSEGFRVYLVTSFKKQLVESASDVWHGPTHALVVFGVERGVLFIKNELKSGFNGFELEGSDVHTLGAEVS